MASKQKFVLNVQSMGVFDLYLGMYFASSEVWCGREIRPDQK